MKLPQFNSLDKAFALALAVIVFLTALVLARGDRTFPKVNAFNRHQDLIASVEKQLLFTFNREMDRQTVEQGLQITPSIAGRYSWFGKKMAFTPNQPLQPGQRYQIRLQEALDSAGKPMQAPFESWFETTPERLLYIGSQDEENFRLVMWNFQREQKTLLTPPNLRVTLVKPTTDPEWLFFLAADLDNPRGELHWTASVELYRLNLQTLKVERVFQPDAFITLDFDITPNGRTLVVLRILAEDEEEDSIPVALWSRRQPEEDWQVLPKLLIPDSPIHLSPNGRFVVGKGPSGFVLESLGSAGEPQFLGRFFKAYGFSPDGNQILLTENAKQVGMSLFNQMAILNSQGQRTQAGDSEGFMTHLRFGRNGDAVYFVMTRTENDVAMVNPFHLYRYDIQANRIEQLANDTRFSEEAFDVAYDNSKLVVERFETSKENNFGPELRTRLEETTGQHANAALWLYDIQSKRWEPLNIDGRNPVWMP